MAASTERVRVTLPKGFDPARHMKALEKLIGDAHGDGFEIDSLEAGMAVATRQVAITEVHHTEKSKTKEVRLPRTVKPADGEKMAVKLADQHGDGWEMTKFEPFLGRATLTQLSPGLLLPEARRKQTTPSLWARWPGPEPPRRPRNTQGGSQPSICQRPQPQSENGIKAVVLDIRDEWERLL